MEASNNADITNTLCERTQGCIVLCPTGNVQGSIACFDLETGCVLKRWLVTWLPMPDRVVKEVLQ